MPILISTRRGLFLVEGGDVLASLEEEREFLALAAAPSAPELCFAATADGQVFRSEGGGSTWEAAGAIPEYVELSSLAVAPEDPQHLFAGMEPAALFRSSDGGMIWNEDSVIRGMSETNGWSVPWSDALGHVRNIAIDPREPRRIYLAIEVGGVVRTEDDGATWENVRGGIHDDVHMVAVDPGDPRRLYASTRHGFGISEDFGQSWRRVEGFEGQGYSRTMALHPGRPGRIFAAAATAGPSSFSRPTGAECGIYRSEDGGETWTHLTHGIPAYFHGYVDAIGIDPRDPDHVALGDGEGNVYVSRDAGASWAQTLTLPPIRRLLML